ncbi:3-isopropylmalate dehydrogenase [Alicyclobacillus macrosporangiidus]|uniref:3-isopropylmalate dehydrogenase n=1 Tax=Alicyclobacillus macrosporangiidus TaxID=392015 RepID=UPI000497891C|nr:3-isopropylmalate dehydrogenase [Alicyclobacillus macrosporangiidus]
MEKTIVVLPGDGIGPEVTREAVRLLETVGERFGHTFHFEYAKLGGVAIDETGTPLPDETLQACLKSDAVLLGAVGGPKWDRLPGPKRPEAGLLALRKALGVFANLRPITVYPPLAGASTLKPEVVDGVDFIIVRELTGGLYFGPKERRQGDHGLEVSDTLLYSEQEIERILRLAFELARQRRGRLTSVDKANVLESSRVWREIAERLAPEYPDVQLTHLLVDNAAMQLVKDPRQFDVIVTENMFGDILSDEAAMITGSIGLLPSASLGSGGPGLYEPIHGSAPDIAGKGLANPLATFASVAMMLDYGFGLGAEAEAVRQAIAKTLAEGWRTADIAAGGPALSTEQMGERVRNALR